MGEAYIAGIVPMSTIDWPGKISLVVFFAGCDFKCGFCYNAKLLEFKEEYKKDISEVKAEIKRSANFIDAILFSGGECCLQYQAIMHLAEFAKRLDLKVGIETNGTKPSVVRQLISNRLVDFIGMDIKAPLEPEIFEKVTNSKTFFKTTEEVIENINETLKVLKEHEDKIEIEIRTTVVPTQIYDKKDIEKIAMRINDLRCTWSLQQFRPEQNKLVDKNLESQAITKKEWLESLREHCNRLYPDLRINVKGID